MCTEFYQYTSYFFRYWSLLDAQRTAEADDVREMPTYHRWSECPQQLRCPLSPSVPDGTWKPGVFLRCSCAPLSEPQSLISLDWLPQLLANDQPVSQTFTTPSGVKGQQPFQHYVREHVGERQGAPAKCWSSVWPPQKQLLCQRNKCGRGAGQGPCMDQ